MEELLGLTNPAPLSLTTLTINLLLAIVLTSLIAEFYVRYGHSLSNRAKFAQTLPVLALITVLIISIVKSSLALSLGLVGALSIVRFRTAIKEPEELIYLFMVIAVGLGLGADQRWPTILAVLVILGYLLIRHFMARQPEKNNLYVNISAPNEEADFIQINKVLLDHTAAAELRRFDKTIENLQATYLVQCPDETALAALMDRLHDEFPRAEFTFIEQDNTLGA